MISVPMAAVGGFAALRLQYLYSGQRLDTLTMLGFIILIGTVVNNAILIVNQALNYIRRDGWHHRDAVTESVRGRIRPIFMSTLTTVLGMLPLVLLPGAGSELYRGLGSVVIGGLLVSTIFTLFLVPMLFTLTFELRENLWERSQQRRRPAAPAPRLATAGAPLPSQPLGDPHLARSVAPKTPDEK
jgi:HAE1 family hydrophobic/amphiphilic exporter-1